MPDNKYQKTEKKDLKSSVTIKDSGSMILKNKYTVRGSLIGSCAGFILAAYFNKSKLFGIAVGSALGAFGGNYYGKIELKIKHLNKNGKS